MILPVVAPFWRDRPAHRRWLVAEADSLLAFYEPDLIDPSGGFANLDARGRPLASERARPLHETTRMVHCFAIAHLLGRPGAADIVDHGMKAIRERHRDAKHGGYFWSFDDGSYGDSLPNPRLPWATPPRRRQAAAPLLRSATAASRWLRRGGAAKGYQVALLTKGGLTAAFAQQRDLAAKAPAPRRALDHIPLAMLRADSSIWQSLRPIARAPASPRERGEAG